MTVWVDKQGREYRLHSSNLCEKKRQLVSKLKAKQ